MTEGFGPAISHLLSDFATRPGVTIYEDVTVCRIDGVLCSDAALLSRLAKAAQLAADGGFGGLDIFGAVTELIEPAITPFDEVQGDTLQIVLRKANSPGWRYFVTCQGFERMLGDEELLAQPLTVWVNENFDPFAAATLLVTTWNSAKLAPEDSLLERPRKLVRDQTHDSAPAAIGPWMLTKAPKKESQVFAAWRGVALKRLTSSLPYEIRLIDGRQNVVLKGARSRPIEAKPVAAGRQKEMFNLLNEAAKFVYTLPKETETRFLFLNNHLSLDWRDNLPWPEGLAEILAGSLAGAKEALAFHIEGESKDTLKALGDLRKSLQDEVSKAQSATRDLLSALWRDIVVAGIVLALKAPAAQQLGGAEAVRGVPLATAALLLLSLAVTVLANWRFNVLADRGRRDWRKKLYSFVDKREWKHLVEKPISRGRWVYRMALPFVTGLYFAVVWYLYRITDPSVFAELTDFAKYLARI